MEYDDADRIRFIAQQQERKESIKASFDKTQRIYNHNKVLHKFLTEWIRENDSPAQNSKQILSGKVHELIEEIEMSNFKNEIKLRRWYSQLNQ